MRLARALLLVVGVAAAVQGVHLLLDQGGANLRSTATWLVGGVVLHDFVLAPATVVLAAALTTVFKRGVPKPVIVALVALTTVTVVGIPVLGRFGARPDNPTLLDRDYTAGWWLLAGIAVSAAAIGVLWQRRSAGSTESDRTT